MTAKTREDLKGPSRLSDLVQLMRSNAISYFNSPLQFRLARIKRYQKDKFELLREKFAERYRALKDYDVTKFVVPSWRDYNSRLEKAVMPSPSFSFLRIPIISHTMFLSRGGRMLGSELLFLKSFYGLDKLKNLLIEDYVGNPPLMNSEFLTSHNTIHHLFHYARFSYRTRVGLDRLRSVVEWGGGYGNQAKILCRHNIEGLTYTVVDTPLFSCLQWLYLSTVLGDNRTNLMWHQTDRLVTGSINLLPLCFLKENDMSCDLFVSTWGLSESSAAAQEYVSLKRWFGAKHILLAYQDRNEKFPAADRITDMLDGRHTVSETVPYAPGSHYLFQ
jgi:hypothetical protein